MRATCSAAGPWIAHRITALKILSTPSGYLTPWHSMERAMPTSLQATRIRGPRDQLGQSRRYNSRESGMGPREILVSYMWHLSGEIAPALAFIRGPVWRHMHS